MTFYNYRGSLVDSKAMNDIISFLNEAGIAVPGVILDRGYCDSKALDDLNSSPIPYVIMVKGNPSGCSSTMEVYGNRIKHNANYLVRGTYLYGVQNKVQPFEPYPH